MQFLIPTPESRPTRKLQVARLVSGSRATCFRRLPDLSRKVAQLSTESCSTFRGKVAQLSTNELGDFPTSGCTTLRKKGTGVKPSDREPRHRHRRFHLANRNRTTVCLPSSCSATRNRLSAWRLSVRRRAGS